MTGATCQYCGQREPGGSGRCGHCGAPLPNTVAAPADPVSPASAAQVRQAEPSATQQADSSPTGLAAGKARLLSQVEAAVPRGYPRWQWQAVAAGMVVLVLLGVLVIRSCSVSMPDLGGPGGLGAVGAPGQPAGSAVEALPAALRNTAACRPHSSGTGVDTCVIAAGDPLLSGGITGGRELSFQVQLVSGGRLAQTVQQWRSSAGTVVSDGAVFAAVSASATVLFADTRSGLRVDTGSFTGQSGARTFLARSGLLQ